MCGIVGVIGRTVASSDARAAIRQLLVLSESRGSEAAGAAIALPGKVLVAKSPRSARRFARSSEFADLFAHAQGGLVAAIGHTRMVTNGSAIFADNNQPVATAGHAMIHNGIIVNAGSLWVEADVDDAPVEVDSAALLHLIDAKLGDGRSLASAVADSFAGLNGSASVALISEHSDNAVLATNNGSLYLGVDAGGNAVMFASERVIVERFQNSKEARPLEPIAEVVHLEPGQIADISGSDGTWQITPLPPYVVQPSDRPSSAVKIVAEAGAAEPPEGAFRRCTKCILPVTFPFIEFDDAGVCSLCRDYVPVPEPQDIEAVLGGLRRGTGEPDCILAFSGGRDSAFALHRLVTDFGMKPLVLTYDWGMVTDLARRNQARLTGQLGIEQILVSADIGAKRRNIRRNLLAWAARPDLGMVPLLMAGDKQFFSESARVAKETGVNVVMFCVNPLEYTYFKSGFAGTRGTKYYNEGFRKTFSLMRYYGGQFVRNPRYVNSSLLDSASAFKSSFFTPHEYVQLFDYMSWDEDEINQTLTTTYNWETDPSTPTTWRIGDGTAPFYNWVYHETVGFTENDTFRSNQVREGLISRSRALELANAENEIRWDRIEEYLDLLDLTVDPIRAAVAKLADQLAAERSGR